MRGDDTATFFGQAWLIINLLLTGVYYIPVTIIRRQHDSAIFAHLTLGLFALQLVGTSITSGATSITSSGKLLVNTPRRLIPLSVVPTAFFRFLPTMPVYFVLTGVGSPNAAVLVLSCHHDRVQHGVGGLLCGTPDVFPRHVEFSAVSYRSGSICSRFCGHPNTSSADFRDRS